MERNSLKQTGAEAAQGIKQWVWTSLTRYCPRMVFFHGFQLLKTTDFLIKLQQSSHNQSQWSCRQSLTSPLSQLSNLGVSWPISQTILANDLHSSQTSSCKFGVWIERTEDPWHCTTQQGHCRSFEQLQHILRLQMVLNSCRTQPRLRLRQEAWNSIIPTQITQPCRPFALQNRD